MSTDVRFEVHTHRHPPRRYPTRGLPFQSPWWLLLLLGGTVAALLWLGGQAYTAGTFLA